ncbi:MAG: NADH-quinone oxidoreductase subunit J [Nocardioides sp.]
MIAFWILAPVMVAAALGILFVRKAVHAALLLAVVMVSIAVLYAVLEAPFLFAVQIIVYTGAILMLFLFVLMLVGVDASDSVVETIRGQRLLAILGGLLLGTVLVTALAQASSAPRPGWATSTSPATSRPSRTSSSPATSSPSRSPRRCSSRRPSVRWCSPTGAAFAQGRPARAGPAADA